MKNKKLKWSFQSTLALSVLALGLGLAGKLWAQDAVAVPEAEYVVEDIQGTNVQVLEDGASDWEKAQEGQELESGDEIKVGAASQATLTLESDTSVHLDANTDLKVDQIVETNEAGGFLSRLVVTAGNILADVKKKLEESQSSFEVDANGVVCGVRGTAFDVSVQGTDVQTATHEGEVEVSSGNETHQVTAGNLSDFRGARFRLMRRLNASEIQGFKRWRTFRAIVFRKRLRRIEAIRNHLRKPWVRRHPRLAARARKQVGRQILKRQMLKKKKWDRKKDQNN